MLREQMKERILAKLQSVLAHQPLNLDYLNFLIRHELILFESLSHQIDGVSDIVEALHNIHLLIQREISASFMTTVEQETEVGPGPGHPKIIIEEEKLRRLLDTHLTVSCIAKCLNVSRSTFYKRMREIGLFVRHTYSSMTDEELDSIILGIKVQIQMLDTGWFKVIWCHWVSVFNGKE